MRDVTKGQRSGDAQPARARAEEYVRRYFGITSRDADAVDKLAEMLEQRSEAASLVARETERSCRVCQMVCEQTYGRPKDSSALLSTVNLAEPRTADAQPEEALVFGNKVKAERCLRYGGPCTGGPDESCGECSGMTAVHEQRKRRESPSPYGRPGFREASAGRASLSDNPAEKGDGGPPVPDEDKGASVSPPLSTPNASLAPRRIVAGDRLRITSINDTWEADVVLVNPRNVSWPIHIVKVTDTEYSHRKGAEFEWGLDDLSSICHADGAPIDPPPFWHDEMRRLKRGPYKETATLSVGAEEKKR